MLAPGLLFARDTRSAFLYPENEERNLAMTLTLNLRDKPAAALQAKAAAEGLTLEAWLEKLAEAELSATPGTLQAAANIVLEEMCKVPADSIVTMVKDGASQHDHYLYGWPKKEA